MKGYLFIASVLFFLLPQLIIAQINNSEEPESMMYHSLVYHDSSSNVILLGGVSKHGWISDISEVWEFNSRKNDWTKLCEYDAISDSSVHSQSPVYDKESNRIIVFNSKGETWAFHTKTKSWENMNPDSSPSPRCGHNMAYDDESDRVILFGGFGCTSIEDPIFDDTWVYNYNSNSWTKVQPSKNPSARMYASMAYNSERDRTVLWGGRLIEPLEDNSLWEYNLNKNEWEQIESEGGPQNTLAYPSMIYNTKKNEITLFGGGILESPFVGNQVNQLWNFDFEDMIWEQVVTKASPPPVSLHSMVYMPNANKVILFGGEVEGMYSNKKLHGTWILNLNNYKWKKY